MNETMDGLKQALAQLQAQQATAAALPAAEFGARMAALERQILDLVLAPAAAAGAAPAANLKPASPAVASAVARPSGLLLATLGAGVLALATLGYLWKGSPGPTPEEAAAASQAASRSPNAEQIAAMTDKLAQRLQDRPDDVEGWSMLARSYSVLGRHAEALQAYAKASALRPNDATMLADYADSMAVNRDNSLDGEPMQLVNRALKLDPNNLKALYLAGTQAFNQQKYPEAVRQWEKLARVGPPGNVFVREVESAIAEARKLGGLPAAQSAAVEAGGPAGAASGKAPVGATVRGTVTLSAALARQAQPEDTLFVFARAAEGSRMPLAILRKQVKDLPLRFELNDTMAMSPDNALSSASQVVVGARISKSGNAMPQAGDLTGQSPAVAVGSSGLQIEIRAAVQP